MTALARLAALAAGAVLGPLIGVTVAYAVPQTDRPNCDRYVTGSAARERCFNARRDCRVYTTGSEAYARCNAADRPVHRRTRRAPDAPAERAPARR